MKKRVTAKLVTPHGDVPFDGKLIKEVIKAGGTPEDFIARKIIVTVEEKK